MLSLVLASVRDTESPQCVRWATLADGGIEGIVGILQRRLVGRLADQYLSNQRPSARTLCPRGRGPCLHL